MSGEMTRYIQVASKVDRSIFDMRKKGKKECVDEAAEAVVL